MVPATYYTVAESFAVVWPRVGAGAEVGRRHYHVDSLLLRVIFTISCSTRSDHRHYSVSRVEETDSIKPDPLNATCIATLLRPNKVKLAGERSGYRVLAS